MKRRSTSDRARILAIRRIIIYSVLTALLATAQCSFFASLHILPATPDLMLGLVLAILLFDSVQAASIVALGAGVLLDALGAGSIFLSPLFYFAVCLIFCLPASKMLPRFFSFCLLLLPGLVLRALFTALCLTLYIGTRPSLSLLMGALLPELITTALFCLPIYPIVKLCRLPLSPRRAFRF